MDANIIGISVNSLTCASQRHNVPSDLANPGAKSVSFLNFDSFKHEIQHQIMKVHDTRRPWNTHSNMKSNIRL